MSKRAMKNKRHNPYFSLQTEKKSRKERFLSKTDGESVYINVLPLFSLSRFRCFLRIYLVYLFFIYQISKTAHRVFLGKRKEEVTNSCKIYTSNLLNVCVVVRVE